MFYLILNFLQYGLLGPKFQLLIPIYQRMNCPMVHLPNYQTKPKLTGLKLYNVLLKYNLHIGVCNHVVLASNKSNENYHICLNN